MEQQYNTSFIPKKFLGDNVGGSSSGTQFVKRRSVMGPGYYLAVLLFIVALVASGGVFAYTKLTQKNIEQLITDLDTRKNNIDIARVESLLRLNKRLTSTNELLNNHVAVSPLLALLEEKTLKDIQYLTLQFGSDDTGGELAFTVHGQATDFKQVALQAKQFEGLDLLHAPTVTTLEYSEKPESSLVDFDLHVGIDPRLVSYSMTLQRSGVPQSTTPPPPVPQAQTNSGSSTVTTP